MKEKRAPTKVVKGGFRATLALFFSILALILSVMTYYRDTGSTDLRAEIKELQQKLDKLKQDTSERVSKAREETANAIRKIGEKIKKFEQEQLKSEDQ